MNDLERLSADYSALKDKHYELKGNYELKRIENKNLDERNRKLFRQINELKLELENKNSKMQEELDALRENTIVALPKGSSLRHYVSTKKFNAQKKLLENFIDLFHKERDKVKALTEISESQKKIIKNKFGGMKIIT